MKNLGSEPKANRNNFSENEKNKTAIEAHKTLLASNIKIEDVFGNLSLETSES